jgi:hypothetical protein
MRRTRAGITWSAHFAGLGTVGTEKQIRLLTHIGRVARVARVARAPRVSTAA